MDKENIARCLIIKYLESCAANETKNVDELEVSIDCLKNLWGIEDPKVNLPGVNSIVDLIPDITYDPQKAVEFKNQGNQALGQGNTDEAIRLYTEAIKCDPSQYVFYSNRSAAYTKKEDYDNAIKDAEKAISLNPSFPKSYSRLGFALWKLGRIEEARQAYQRGIRSCTDNQALKENLASLDQSNPSSSSSSTSGQSAGGAGGNAQNPFASLGQMFGNNPMFAQLAQRLEDPAVQAALQEPEMQELVQQIQANPASLMTMMGDPRFSKLLGLIMGQQN